MTFWASIWTAAAEKKTWLDSLAERTTIFRLMMVSCQLYRASEWLFWDICAVAGEWQYLQIIQNGTGTMRRL